MGGSTGNPKGVRILIAIFVLALIAIATGLWSSKSDAQEAFTAGYGVALVGSENCFNAMLLTQTFHDRDWMGWFATHGDSDQCRNRAMKANFGAGITRNFELDKWTLGIGAGILEHGDAAIGPKLGPVLVMYTTPEPGPNTPLDEYYPSSTAFKLSEDNLTSDRMQMVAALFIRRRIGRWLSVDILHNSTGGATEENRGINTIALSAYVEIH